MFSTNPVELLLRRVETRSFMFKLVHTRRDTTPLTDTVVAENRNEHRIQIYNSPVAPCGDFYIFCSSNPNYHEIDNNICVKKMRNKCRYE